ncbi:RHS repeat-associated protein [Corynebacterium felinum]|uniref:RHS repeat-associated protein n=1 Tax=Corynebacterium felinum TaxID=131318 RepID=A0ABU2BCC4_9CORY|nr:RHS repeat-associated core domain-containing protein [Corynebacterium felinum]MDR7355393.1 RHS repeat-associated protein [Corynebacterium felinum]
MISHTSSTGAVTTTEFNADGVQTAVRYDDGRCELIRPGAWGVPVEVVDTAGLVTQYQLDECGCITQVSAPDGAVTRFEYDLRVTGIVPSAVVDQRGQKTVVICDDAGRKREVIDPVGRKYSWVLDACGHPVSFTDPHGAMTTMRYTPAGWPVEIVHPDHSSVVFSYDGEGNLVSRTNEIGETKKIRYTVFDRPVEIIDENGAKTTVEYNTQMEPIRLLNADQNLWSFHYDRDGVMAQQCDYNQRVTSYRTSADGRTAITSTAAGEYQVHMDAYGVIQQISDAGRVTTYSYDPQGRVSSIVNGDARLAYTYDEFGRLVQETTTCAGGQVLDTVFSYSPERTVAAISHVLPTGAVVSTRYQRDEIGEINQVQLDTGDDFASVVGVCQLGSDQAGRRNRVVIDSVLREFGFDSRGRVIADHTQVLDSFAEGHMRQVTARRYCWRADNALTGIDDLLRGGIGFDLDAFGQVVGVRKNLTPATHPVAHSREKYQYSAAGMLSGHNVADSASQIPLSRDHAEAMEFSGTMPTRVGRTQYQYDRFGRVVTTITKRISKKPLVRTFYYAGSSTQPVGFHSSDTPSVGYRYRYDGLGRRVAKETINTHTGEIITTVLFGHIGSQLTGEHEITSDTHSSRMWVHDPRTGQVLAQAHLKGTHNYENPAARWSQEKIDAEFYAIITNLAGAPQEIIDPKTGAIAGIADQTLFGVRTWRGDIHSPLLFAGQYRDEESGWVYNRFRYYQPDSGVYNAQDPLGVTPKIATTQGYVHNPNTWIDFFGLASCPIKETVQRINGRLPINYRAAGETLRLPDHLHKAYGETIRFTDEGFPIFDDFVHEINGRPADLVMDLQYAGTTRSSHFSYCDKQVGITKEYRRDHKLTWHHHQDVGRMQLVPRDLHDFARHTGGFSIWG